MKKRWLCGTMALVIGAMAMAGCSGGNSSSSASAAGTEAADSGSSVDTSGAEMTIRVAHVCGTGSPYDYVRRHQPGVRSREALSRHQHRLCETPQYPQR